MSRFVDRGAITAAYVGIGMAVTIGVSFLLVIPIEPIYWLLTPLAGLMIGYYANQRSNRGRGAWRRVVANGLFAGVVTGLTLAALLLAVKVLFFTADSGYRDASLGGSILARQAIVGRLDELNCAPGGDCVYERYVDAGKRDELAAIGVTDATSFSRFYWNQQLATTGLLFGIASLTGLFGGLAFAITRPPNGQAAVLGQSIA